MGLFRRSASQKSSDEAVAAEGSGTEETAADAVGTPGTQAPVVPAAGTRGPFDSSQVSELGARADLGAIWLPGVPGMELRMEVDKKTQKITGAAVAVNGSALQIQAFAAPKTMGIWDEIREEIAESVRQQGGTVDDIPGTFGRELLAKLPATGPDGQQGFRAARFVGVDGPRWFLRGVLTGKAAADPEAARLLESVFANIVVVRDQNARPPRDLLAMHLPGQAQRPAAAAPEGAAPSLPTFDPLTRGPEITERR